MDNYWGWPLIVSLATPKNGFFAVERIFESLHRTAKQIVRIVSVGCPYQSFIADAEALVIENRSSPGATISSSVPSDHDK